MCSMDKAPGPDGFTMGFFIKCWEVLKQDIMEVFHNFHSFVFFERSLNATLQSLDPEEEWFKRIKGFQTYKSHRQHLQDHSKGPGWEAEKGNGETDRLRTDGLTLKEDK